MARVASADSSPTQVAPPNLVGRSESTVVDGSPHWRGSYSHACGECRQRLTVPHGGGAVAGARLRWRVSATASWSPRRGRVLVPRCGCCQPGVVARPRPCRQACQRRSSPPHRHPCGLCWGHRQGGGRPGCNVGLVPNGATELPPPASTPPTPPPRIWADTLTLHPRDTPPYPTLSHTPGAASCGRVHFHWPLRRPPPPRRPLSRPAVRRRGACERRASPPDASPRYDQPDAPTSRDVGGRGRAG